MLFYALGMVPTLEKLTVQFVTFSSPEIVEQFLARSERLKELSLDHVFVSNDEATGAETAHAFRRGLQRNQTLAKIEVAHYGKEESFLIREILLGIMGNQTVRQLGLVLQYSSSENRLSALRSLLSCTASIQEVEISTDVSVSKEVFRGIACNRCVQKLKCSLDGQMTSKMDTQVASAIREFFGSNKTLRVFHINSAYMGDLKFGPASIRALSNGLAQKSEALQEFHASGHVLSTAALGHVSRLQNFSLQFANLTDWEPLSRRFDGIGKSRCLQVIDLSQNRLTLSSLEVVLPYLAELTALTELRMEHCRIPSEAATLFETLLEVSRLKKLRLRFNFLGTQGAVTIMDAARKSQSLEHLYLGEEINEEDEREEINEEDEREEINEQDERSGMNLNEHYDCLRGLVADSQLVKLCLAPGVSLERECIVALADGLRATSTLKNIKLPFLEREHIGILGEGLTRNRSLECLHVGIDPDRDTDEDTDEDDRPMLHTVIGAEEDALYSFIEMMPRMQGLVTIFGIFDCQPSARLDQAICTAMKENTSLKHIYLDDDSDDLPANHLCNNETLQFYLELNRFGRKKYFAMADHTPFQLHLLPYILARMTGPEHSSHLYHFLRVKANLLASAQQF